jgi:hypothetical protein
MTRIALLGIAALAACAIATASEFREVHVDVGSKDVPLIATAQIKDYRSAPLDLSTPVASGDSQITRFLKTYFASGRAGDVKTWAALFGEQAHEVQDHYPTAQSLKEQFEDLRTVHLTTVLYWGEYQVGVVHYDNTERQWLWGQAARCDASGCQMADYANGHVSQLVAMAFAESGEVRLVVPAEGETLLPILPVVGVAQKAVTTHPIVLHLNRSSKETTAAATKLAATLTDGPWNVSDVYSLGQEVSVALLKSHKEGAIRLLPLQRSGTDWIVISKTYLLDGWAILSSGSVSQALQRR